MIASFLGGHSTWPARDILIIVLSLSNIALVRSIALHFQKRIEALERKERR